MSDLAFVDDDRGEGVCIHLSEGKLVSPFDGVLIDLDFDNQHTIRLLSENGMLLKIKLIISADVIIPSDIFHVYLEPVQRVKKGDKLISFDMHELNKYTDRIDIALVVLNTDNYLGIIPAFLGNIESGELLITTIVSEML